jgi:hypothetical protein
MTEASAWDYIPVTDNDNHEDEQEGRQQRQGCVGR